MRQPAGGQNGHPLRGLVGHLTYELTELVTAVRRRQRVDPGVNEYGQDRNVGFWQKKIERHGLGVLQLDVLTERQIQPLRETRTEDRTPQIGVILVGKLVARKLPFDLIPKGDEKGRYIVKEEIHELVVGDHDQDVWFRPFEVGTQDGERGFSIRSKFSLRFERGLFTGCVGRHPVVKIHELFPFRPGLEQNIGSVAGGNCGDKWHFAFPLAAVEPSGAKGCGFTAVEFITGLGKFQRLAARDRTGPPSNLQVATNGGTMNQIMMPETNSKQKIRLRRSYSVRTSGLLLLGVLTWLVATPLGAFGEESWEPSKQVYHFKDRGASAGAQTIIGKPTLHQTREKETLLDIARRHHLGYLEIVRANPKVDPWIPDPGADIRIPSQWILPDGPRKGLVLNIPEMRMYYYLGNSRVMTVPLGVGVEGSDTPAGRYKIGEKRKDPVWNVPPSIQKEMEEPVKRVPPGPENPLGKYWMRLSSTSYGIHGTNNPWGIGRYVSHGCIRLYPEDIEYLYTRTRPRTPVRVIYQHAKVGFDRGKPYFQVFRHRGYTDAQLMKDLIRKTRALGIDADLRVLRRSLIGVTDGAIVPIPIKDDMVAAETSPVTPTEVELANIEPPPAPEPTREPAPAPQPAPRPIGPPNRISFQDGTAYVRVERRAGYGDGELMRDLIQQTWKLGIDVDLRALRRTIHAAADGAVLTVPLREQTLTQTQ